MDARPSGTRVPTEVRFRTISPNDAFLPPTWSRSARLRSENQTTADVVEGAMWSTMLARYFLLVSHDLWLSVCKITVDISSTDLAEELITGRRWFRYMASAWRSS